MQVGSGWYLWWCSHDFLPKALKQLEEAGCDMNLVKIVQDNNKNNKLGEWNFAVIYKGQTREQIDAHRRKSLELSDKLRRAREVLGEIERRCLENYFAPDLVSHLRKIACEGLRKTEP